MRSTGILRKVDGLGRITLPMELRRVLDISENDQLEIYLEADQVVLRKHEKCCIFCNATGRLVSHNEKLVCQDCIDTLKFR